MKICTGTRSPRLMRGGLSLLLIAAIAISGCGGKDTSAPKPSVACRLPHEADKRTTGGDADQHANSRGEANKRANGGEDRSPHAIGPFRRRHTDPFGRFPCGARGRPPEGNEGRCGGDADAGAAR